MNRMCKNGCNAECYTARLVCKRCVAAEQLARKHAKQGEPKKRGRPNQRNGNIERLERIQSQPLQGFNAFSNDWAKRPLRASA
jgi:hypothetical protein